MGRMEIYTTPSGGTSALTWGTSPIRAMYLNILKVSSVSRHQDGGRLSLYLKISTAIFTFYVAWESLYDTLKVQILATPRAAIWKQSAGKEDRSVLRPGNCGLEENSVGHTRPYPKPWLDLFMLTSSLNGNTLCCTRRLQGSEIFKISSWTFTSVRGQGCAWTMPVQ